MIDFSTLAPRTPPPEPGPDAAPFDAEQALFATAIALALTFDLADRTAAVAVGLDDAWRVGVLEAACRSGQALLDHHPPYQEARARAVAN